MVATARRAVSTTLAEKREIRLRVQKVLENLVRLQPKVSIYRAWSHANHNGTGVMVRWDKLVTDEKAVGLRLLEMEAIIRDAMTTANQLPALVKELDLVAIGSHGQWWCQSGWGAGPRVVLYFSYTK